MINMNNKIFQILVTCLLTASCLHAQERKLNNAFYFSMDIVVDSKGNAFVTGKNNKIIKITPEGKASCFAGSISGFTGDKDGLGNIARFSYTDGIAIDAQDNLYVCDNTRVRKISPGGMVTTVAGLLKAQSLDGNLSIACFLRLTYITVDKSGNIYVTDYAPPKDWKPGQASNTSYYYIRKISPGGMVTTLKNESGGPLIIQYPRSLCCDAEGSLYIAAISSHCIKKITPAGVITTVAGQCDKTILNSVYKPGPAPTSVLTSPSGLAFANNSDLYFSDERLGRIIKISNNKVSTVAGSGKISFVGNPAGASEGGEKDGKALEALFEIPMGIAFDKTGNLYIVDRCGRNNSIIRKLSNDGIVSTFCKHVWNPKTQQYEEPD